MEQSQPLQEWYAQIQRYLEPKEPEIGCKHEFVQYIGITEMYKFCKICDLKLRPDEDADQHS